MGLHENVRAFPQGGGNQESVADVGPQLDNQFKVVGSQYFIGKILEDRGTSLIRPDGERTGGFRGRGFGGGFSSSFGRSFGGGFGSDFSRRFGRCTAAACAEHEAGDHEKTEQHGKFQFHLTSSPNRQIDFFDECQNLSHTCCGIQSLFTITSFITLNSDPCSISKE
jgi:hypothetical protein